MLEIFSQIIGYGAFRQNIEGSDDNMANLTTYTDLYFVNENEVDVVAKSEISK